MLTKEERKEFENKVLEYIFEVEFKPLLEMDENVSDWYDDDKISHDDFYELLEKFKEKIKS